MDHGVAGAPKWINIAIFIGEAMMNIGKTAIFWVLHVRHSEKKTNSILTPEAKGNLTPKYDKYDLARGMARTSLNRTLNDATTQSGIRTAGHGFGT